MLAAWDETMRQLRDAQAQAADGFPKDLRRTVSENARTLQFEMSEFEP